MRGLGRRAAKRTLYKGVWYDSKFEANYCWELEMRKKSGDIEDFSYHYVFPLVVKGIKVCTYEIDFMVYHNNGSVEYVECKGWEEQVWKLKWKLFKALYGYGREGRIFTVVKKT